jgi:exosortase/archaeosortase family protein
MTKPKHFLRKQQILLVLISVVTILHFTWPFLLKCEIPGEFLQTLATWISRKSALVVIHLIVTATDIPVRIGEGESLLFENGNRIVISPGCSGLKQVFQLFFVLILLPGPVKQKVWFIPAGVILLLILNIIRICSLSLVLDSLPAQWKFFHDWILRPVPYLFIFVYSLIGYEINIRNRWAGRGLFPHDAD